MKTITLTYVIALAGVAMIVFGIYCLIKERAAELRGHIPAIQTIAVGFVLIGLARAVQLLLLILVTNWTNRTVSATAETDVLLVADVLLTGLTGGGR
jgi:membrane-bound ClpP family serine protease